MQFWTEQNACQLLEKGMKIQNRQIYVPVRGCLLEEACALDFLKNHCGYQLIWQNGEK